MVQVGIVGMLVPERRVDMTVAMRLGHGAFMMVAVMLVMDVAMLVLQSCVEMVMVVPLSQVQP